MKLSFRLSSTRSFLESVLPDLARRYRVPGISVAAIASGRISWIQQYGVRSAKTQENVTKDTIFEACSLTKPLSAYCVLKLVEQGIIQLDVPLVKYLGQNYIEDELLHRKITARMVLTHTSGLPNWRPGGRDSHEPLTVHFEPGTDYLYSGEGFWFLQRVLEHIVNMPLDRWIDAMLLKPLGMGNSSMVWRNSFLNFATGHDKNGNIETVRSLFTRPNAAFSLYTTPTDYAIFIEEILNQDRTAPHSLREETLTQMLSPQYEIPHQKHYTNRQWRSLGWEISETEDTVYHGHNGSNRESFRCFCIFDFKGRNGLVLMTNAGGGEHIKDELLQALH